MTGAWINYSLRRLAEGTPSQQKVARLIRDAMENDNHRKDDNRRKVER